MAWNDIIKRKNNSDSDSVESLTESKSQNSAEISNDQGIDKDIHDLVTGKVQSNEDFKLIQDEIDDLIDDLDDIVPTKTERED